MFFLPIPYLCTLICISCCFFWAVTINSLVHYMNRNSLVSKITVYSLRNRFSITGNIKDNYLFCYVQRRELG